MPKQKIRLTITKEYLARLSRGQSLTLRTREGGEIEVVMDAGAMLMAKFSDLMNKAAPYMGKK